MSNLKDWILQQADGDPVEAVVLGEMGGGHYGSEVVSGHQEPPIGRVMSFDKAAPFLSYEFYDGFGSVGCHAIYAWTRTKVIFVSQYDGATTIQSVPRNPKDCLPEMAGGG
jgi:hypothetical protein